MVGLVKRGRFWHCFAKVAGRVLWHSTGHEHVADARVARERWLAEVRAAAAAPKRPPRSFAQFVEVYREKHARHLRSYPKSLRYLLDGMVEHLGHARLGAITADTLEQMRAWLRTRDLSTATRNRWLVNLQAALHKAHEWGMIGAAQLADVRRVRQEREDNARLRVLTEAEQKALIGKLDTNVIPIAMAALHTGCRLGELLRLRWTDVNGDMLHVRPENAKSKRARDVPLDGTMMALLDTLPRASPFVFPGRGGRRRVTVAKQFVAAVRAAGLQDVCFHSLRHTFCSRLASQGAMERDLCELLGWTSSRMAARYTHLSRPHLRALVERIDKPGRRQVSKRG